eukprot:TRINITY_DN10825_c1_g1_i8.p1 TRINITY_DN10825_c1_g1~~TRINITY_DN10825_c1_g1_i8.p1  ORF type:complete len:268 (+),score=76.80 TRINITY_DN10825_c1_g1_i8:100-903(+)
MCVGAYMPGPTDVSVVGIAGIATAQDAAVQEAVASAHKAAAAAGSKAVRRRVRQRLHKRLGQILPELELKELMDKFKADTVQDDVAETPSQQVNEWIMQPQLKEQQPQQSLPQQLQLQAKQLQQQQAWAPFQPVLMNVFVPIPMPRNAFELRFTGPQLDSQHVQERVVCAVQNVTKLEEKTQIPEIELDASCFKQASCLLGGTVAPAVVAAKANESFLEKSAKQNGNDHVWSKHQDIWDGVDLPTKSTFIHFKMHSSRNAHTRSRSV